MSFHDLHPGSRAACARFLAGLGRLGISRISLLVVPRWHGAPPFTEDPDFTAWLQELAAAGHDICLHGFYHRVDTVTGGPIDRLIGRCYTASEGEYHQIDHPTATDRIQRGLRILTEEAGLPVVGFTPPAWLLSPSGRTALIEAGLQYTTTFATVELLQLGRIVRAPTIVYSCRSAWRRGVSRIWVRFWGWLHASAPVLRIAAHPCDFDHPAIERSLWNRIRGALADGRVSATYDDLLPGSGSLAPADPHCVA